MSEAADTITVKFMEHSAEVLKQLETVETELADSKTKNAELVGRLTAIEQEVAKRQRSGGRDYASSPGELVTASAGFKSFGGSRHRGKFSVEVKTILSTSTSGGALVVPDFRPDPVLMARRPLTIRDLLTVSQTTSNAVEYPKQLSRTNNAAVVTEGATKPQSDYTFELKTVPVRTIAHYVKASKQILDDAGQLRSTIDSELRYGLKLTEENELLSGDGTGQHLSGLVTQATAFSSGTFPLPALPNRLDVLLQAIAQVQSVSQLPVDGIVLNDVDLEALRSIKDSQGRYVSDGPFGGPITSIWGKPAVGTPAMSEGDFLVGSFKVGATLFDRWDATVLISTENESDFIQNLVTVLAEERLALAVRRPDAFVEGDFGAYT
jgi:HK97 family phage major capsid protein